MSATRREPTINELAAGVRACDRAMVGRAITLVESRLPGHREQAQALLQQLLPHAGQSQRVGITGVPGVGKSTFIEALGGNLTAAGHRVAVLAVDPSSSVSGGSILGDKTRMTALATDPAAFIRPSPAAGTLGGVARKTRETMLVLEAAGFDVVLVETVGVGQSETLVAGMVDFFLVLLLPGAGDDLQGIKRGLIELADLIAVNKADADNRDRARLAVRDYRAALRVMRPDRGGWAPPVLACSALHNEGLAELWDQVEAHRNQMTASGAFTRRRHRQLVAWMWNVVEDRLLDAFRSHPAVRTSVAALEADVTAGHITPGAAADKLLALFLPQAGDDPV